LSLKLNISNSHAGHGYAWIGWTAEQASASNDTRFFFKTPTATKNQVGLPLLSNATQGF